MRWVSCLQALYHDFTSSTSAHAEAREAAKLFLETQMGWQIVGQNLTQNSVLVFEKIHYWAM